MPSARSTRRAIRRNIPLMVISEFFAELRIYLPVAILIFESLTGSYTLGMSVFAVTFLAMAFFEVPTGVLSDKWGRRGTFIAGSVAEAVAVFVYALAYSYPEYALWLLYIGSVIHGFSSALFSGNNQALIYDTLACYRRTKDLPIVLGRMSSMGQAGLAVSGILAGGLIWVGVTYHTLLLLSFAPLVINILLSYLTVEPPRHYVEDGTSWAHMKKAAKLLAKNPNLRGLTAAYVIQTGAGYANYYFMPSFIASVWPNWLIPIFRSGQHMIGSVGFWFAGPVVKAFSAYRMLFVGTVLSHTVVLGALAMASALSPALLMLTQLSYAFTTTANQTVQHDNFTDAQRATMGSLISFGGWVISAVVSLFMGFLSDITSPAIALFSIFLARSIPVNWIYFSLYKKHK